MLLQIIMVIEVHVQEVRSTERVHSGHLKGLCSLVADYPRTKRRIVVCHEPRTRKTSDGIEIMPAKTFVRGLLGGEVV